MPASRYAFKCFSKRGLVDPNSYGPVHVGKGNIIAVSADLSCENIPFGLLVLFMCNDLAVRRAIFPVFSYSLIRLPCCFIIILSEEFKLFCIAVYPNTEIPFQFENLDDDLIVFPVHAFNLHKLVIAHTHYLI
jgi:hypothetical protein